MAITVTISAPSSAVKGAWFNISGIVMDNGEPLSYVDVYLYYNGTLLDVTQTGGDGDYLEPCRIYVAGNWTLKAYVDIDGTGEDTRPITIVEVPTVTTQNATNIVSENGTYSATLHGTITDTGFENCDRRGFEWGPSSGNYTQGWNEAGSFGVGSFQRTTSFQGTVYFRAYARNSAGYGYGSEKSFDPPEEPPDPPTNVSATDGTHSDKVRITWTKSEGATSYQVYRDGVGLGWVGDVSSFDDFGAGAPSITPGSAVASDGTYADKVYMYLSGTGTNNGTVYTYKVKARGAGGDSGYSGTNTGYRGPGSLNYQWYRSAGDSDASYSYIPGATSSTYSDYDAPEDGSGRYYKCYLTASGCQAKYSSPDRGYRSTINPPTVTTQEATGIGWDNGTFHATLHGTITDTGGENCGARGFEWGYSSGAPYAYGWQEEGFYGTGAFNRLISELTQKVYFRARAQNSAGWGYGGELSFDPPPPEAVTMIGEPTGWSWGNAVLGTSVVPITTDGGKTWAWGVVQSGDVIPDGGPTGWEWVEC